MPDRGESRFAYGVVWGATGERIHDLHRRHGEEVQAALVEGHRRHAAEFQAGKLPDSCVLVLAVPTRYRQQVNGPPSAPTFRRTGDHWNIWFENENATLRNGVGPRYLAQLLAHAGRHLHVIDMQIAEAILSGELDPTEFDEGYIDADEAGHAVRGSPASSGTPCKTSIQRAVRDCRARLDQIEELMDAARARGDGDALLELGQEAEVVGRYIRSAVDLRGNPRPSADDDERARQAVTRAISRTINNLWKKHPPLARHLGKHLTKGVKCLYDPDPPVTWVTE